MTTEKVDIGDFFSQKLIEWVSAFEESVKQYGPDTINLFLNTIRFDLMSKLVVGWIFFLLFVSVFVLVYRKYETVCSYFKNDDFRSFVIAIVVILSLFGLGVSSSFVFDRWAYIGAVEPKMYLAKKALDKVFKGSL